MDKYEYPDEPVFDGPLKRVIEEPEERPRDGDFTMGPQYVDFEILLKKKKPNTDS